MGFTHAGRKLGQFYDDFKDDIPVTSDEEQDNDKLNEEMVTAMNFGGGNDNKE